jgi:predicted Zn-dependent peptidase
VNRICRSLALVFVVATAGCRTAKTSTPPAATAVDTAAILASSDLPALQPEPLAGDPLGVTVHRLSNGMTVYLSTVRDEPRVQGWIAVRAGGRHDPAHATGLAHYLEHMLLFKGTDELGTVDHAAELPHLERTRVLYRELATAKSPVDRERIHTEIDTATLAVARTSIKNELFRLYDRLGFTSIDARTYAEKTYYHAQLPANRIDAWATIASEQLADPVFRLFYPELEAVYEEKNRNLDSPEARMYDAMMRGLFSEHPYGTQNVLGEPEHLKTPAFDEMVAFFERWYVPNNMAIILVGDVDASVLPLLEQRFGRLQARTLEPVTPGVITPLDRRIETEVRAPGEPSVMIAWQAPAIDHPDSVALELARALLQDPRVSPLDDGLVRPGKAAWTNAWGEPRREAGYLVVEAPVRDDTDHVAIEAELRAAVGRLRGLPPATIEAIKLRAAMERAYGAERTEPRANRILAAFTLGLDWSEMVERDGRFDALTAADLAAAVDRWLGAPSLVVRRVAGGAEPLTLAKPKITPLVFADAEQSAFAKRVAAMPAAPIEPAFVTAERSFTIVPRPSGEVIATKNTRNDLFALTFEIERGHRAAPLLCHALDVWQRSGTAQLDAAALQQRLFELGAYVETSCDADRVRIELGGVDRNLEPAFAVLEGWLDAPVLGEALVREAAKTVLSERKAALDDDDAITAALRDHVYFGSDSATRALPSNRAIDTATSKQLRALVVGLTSFRQRVLYFGPRSADEIAALAVLGAGNRSPEPRRPRTYGRHDGVQIHLVHRPSAKATVEVLLTGPPSATGAHTVPGVVGWELARESWNDIRGARALAYSVRAGIDLGRAGDEVSLFGWLQAQPDKVAQAVPAMLAVLGVDALGEAALDRAKSAWRETLRTGRTDPRGIPAYVAAWRDRGLDHDPREMSWAGLDAVSVEATAALLEVLHGRPAIITIVGDTSRIDTEALTELGAVQLHQPADLFAFDR